MEMKFKCSQCGACCRRAYNSELDRAYILPTGACKHLQDDNSCAIYADRPWPCDTDAYYDVKVDKTKVTKKEFFKLLSSGCNEMIKMDNMDEKYLLNTNDK